MTERILLAVHLEAMRDFSDYTDPYGKEAKEALSRIENSRAGYNRIVTIEGDLWDSPFRTDRPKFDWNRIFYHVKKDDSIDICGTQTSICVRKVDEELKKRGFSPNIRRDLCIDLHELRMIEIGNSSSL